MNNLKSALNSPAFRNAFIMFCSGECDQCPINGCDDCEVEFYKTIYKPREDARHLDRAIKLSLK